MFEKITVSVIVDEEQLIPSEQKLNMISSKLCYTIAEQIVTKNMEIKKTPEGIRVSTYIYVCDMDGILEVARKLAKDKMVVI